MGVFFAVLVVAGVAALLVYPYVNPALEPLHESTGPSARIAYLQERKLAIYGAIRDLGFDFRTDKLTKQDYDAEIEALKAEAVAVVTELEELRSEPPRGPEELEAAIRRSYEAGVGTAPGAQPGTAIFCTQCGRQASDADLFCAGCGTKLARR